MSFHFAKTNRLARGARWGTVLSQIILPLSVIYSVITAAPIHASQPKKAQTGPAKLGIQVNDPKAFQGYTLLGTLNSTKTYLVDMEGKVVNAWTSDCSLGGSTFLLENGNLLRAGTVPIHSFGNNLGAGGRFQEQSWDGKLVWDLRVFSEMHMPHHDFCRLPNGNLLILVWEKKSPLVALAAGRRPETLSNYLLSDCVIEIQPTGKTSGKIIWAWNAWDHLIQDYDESKANYGDVGAHPELIDLNFGDGTIAAMIAKPEELEKLRAIGYVGGGEQKQQRPPPTDWLHINSVAYNADLDQIMLSVHQFNEIWVIDHNTTTAEAASHKGGKSGKGGDLLFRWGNPRAYRAGTIKDQKLFGQHNAHWIDQGLPGAGNILLFNNGLRRTGGAYSSVDEISLPDSNGNYPTRPVKPAWTYVAPKRIDFYSPLLSGVQRLPNGNTLICSGTNGTVFEVTPKEEVVWKYVNPPLGPGGPPGFGKSRVGSLFRALRYAPDYPGVKDRDLKPAKQVP